MVTLQDLIHHLEVGQGLRSINRTMRVICCVLGILLLVAAYNLRAFRNLSTQEAMDSAQLGRNLSQGQGFTTLFVRPISIFLVQKHHLNDPPVANLGTNSLAGADRALLKGNHPDLANPPVYPVVLAGLMKTLPFKYAIPKRPKSFWIERYQPDFLIALFNELLLIVVVVLAFLLAKRLFDAQVAWVSALILIGTELLWHFSVSGLSTILLLLEFMLLVWVLVLLDEETRQVRWPKGGLIFLAGLAGALVGLGGLTRYAFSWLILPVLVFVALYCNRQRWLATACALLGFVAVLTPWVVRNYQLSGMPFGIATYAIIENSSFSREDRLERSLNTDLFNSIHNSFPFLTVAAHVFRQKLVANLRSIVQSDLPRLGGSWVSGFFVVGLLVRFRSVTLSRLRVFLLAALVVLAVVQAVGRTKLSDDSPDINSENLLVLTAPLVIIYGVSLFFVVLDQLQLPFFQLRSVAIGVFGSVACLPLILTLLPPKASPLVYPPYHPPSIQNAVSWTKEDELTMSDIPWAVAWYGQSQCVSLTLNARIDFFAINDYLKPVSALYLTPQTVDRWTQSGDWGNLFLQTVRVLPGDTSKYPLRLDLTLPEREGGGVPFPLHYLQGGWPMRMLFTFRPHFPGSP
jgi:hypothetical protein